MSFLCLFGGTANADEPQVVGNSLGMQFVRIPAGEFFMGSPDDDPTADDDERPPRLVRITRPFYLGKLEVTQEQYDAVMRENPSWFSPQGGGRDLVAKQACGALPVEMVTWEEATRFCERLAAVPAEREASRTYRLPTEAEWEYACRAGSTTRYAWGDEPEVRRANVLDPTAPGSRTPQTRPTGSYQPNAWGLHDMHGNVWEWCADRYSAEAYRTAGTSPAARLKDSLVLDPQGPNEGTGRVVRGGDYRFDAQHARSANRDFTRQSRRDLGNGFRVVLMLDVAAGESR